MSARSQTAAEVVDLSVVALPFVLSLIAGSTDTIGFLSLNGLFTAHITGNLVVLAAHVINGDPAILSYVLAVPVFSSYCCSPACSQAGSSARELRRFGRCCCWSCCY
jgi:uncharacterized membrane protein YoaK (UPF0700 family)